MPCVYSITNLVNGAVCIGQTQTTTENRWNELVDFAKDRDLAKTTMPCLKILTSIRKYGAENFKVDTLCEGIYTTAQLDQLEAEEIKSLNEQGITVYHRTGTYVPNEELIDRFCSVEEDDEYFYG